MKSNEEIKGRIQSRERMDLAFTIYDVRKSSRKSSVSALVSSIMVVSLGRTRSELGDIETQLDQRARIIHHPLLMHTTTEYCCWPRPVEGRQT